MKKLLVISLALAMVFAFAGVAAAQGIAEDGIVNSGYGTFAVGDPSPHGGYTDATSKCNVCHAVHGATAGGEALLQTTRANACLYCHVSGGATSLIVYNGADANYTTDYENNHAATHQGAGSNIYAGCVSCHSVHGADTWDPDPATSEPENILKAQPGTGSSGAGAIAADVTSLDEFCVDCHDNRADAGCNNCHGGATGTSMDHVYIESADNGTQHVMTTADNVRAFVSSTNCTSCHSGGDGTQANSFPHLTTARQFLADSTNDGVDDGYDEICLDCHINGLGDAGVGITF
ncbi:MAG: hypothetical protein Kow00129_10860 [Thermoleophilia bacterium]